MTKPPEDLSFFDHLEELRGRVIKCLVVLTITSCLFYQFIDQALSVVIQPIGKLVFTYPTEAFLARITLTILGGFLIALPYILFEIWQFVSLGFTPQEKKYVIIFGPLSLISFFVGGFFAYFVMVPISIRFLLSFSSDVIVPMITVNRYISFMGSLILAFGIVFEMPLILMFLSKMGITTPEFLVQKRRHAIVLTLILSALLTPPDIITQLLMAGPLVLLYEIGIIVSKIAYRPKDQ